MSGSLKRCVCELRAEANAAGFIDVLIRNNVGKNSGDAWALRAFYGVKDLGSAFFDEMN